MPIPRGAWNREANSTFGANSFRPQLRPNLGFTETAMLAETQMSGNGVLDGQLAINVGSAYPDSDWEDYESGIQ